VFTNQSGSQVGGHQAGGSVNAPQYNFAAPAERGKRLSALLEKFKEEVEKNITLQKKIDELEHYETPVANETVVGLEAKLSKGGREDLIEFAREAKERFSKKLFKYQMYESAQHIYAFLLGDVWTRFQLLLRPQIKAGAKNVEISILVQEQIIAPVLDIIPDNILDLCAPDIAGMVFFLTGNCHLKWEK
jgi:hypothetical protein